MPTTEENVQQILKQYCDSNNSLDETLLKGFMTKYFEEIESLFDKLLAL